MANVRMELILLGDGMSGKTSILIKIAEIVIEQAFHRYQEMLLRREVPSAEEWRLRIRPHLHSQQLQRIIERRPVLQHVEQAEYLAWLEMEEPHVISFEEWLRREGIVVEEMLSKDTSLATLGLETFELRFPLGRHFLFVTGYDLGGQNIYDHLRSVLAGLAKPTSYLLIVFDSSRYISCENSINQLEDSIKKWGKHGKKLPSIIAILNKIDLYQFLEDEKRQASWVKWIHETLSHIRSKGITYQVPHVLRPDEFIEFSVNPTDTLGFEHLEAIIYDTIRRNEEYFGQPPLTELNVRALARELAAQMLLLQQSDARFDEFYSELKAVIFEERPLALQHVGGFKIKSPHNQDTKKQVLEDARKKFEPFSLKLEKLSIDDVRMALKKSIGTQDLENDLKQFARRIFKTNAIGGEGIIELFTYLAYLETTGEGSSQQENEDADGQRRTLRRL